MPTTASTIITRLAGKDQISKENSQTAYPAHVGAPHQKQFSTGENKKILKSNGMVKGEYDRKEATEDLQQLKGLQNIGWFPIKSAKLHV